jgi:hypothetical protein
VSGHYLRGIADHPEIRASDAERERVATLLRRHAADGRLDVDELDERLQRAYAARTRSDLVALTADLPDVAPGEAPRPARGRTWGLRERVGSYLAVMALLVVIWVATGADGHFWPMWPALGWGIALLTGKDHPAPVRHRRV